MLLCRNTSEETKQPRTKKFIVSWLRPLAQGKCMRTWFFTFPASGGHMLLPAVFGKLRKFFPGLQDRSETYFFHVCGASLWTPCDLSVTAGACPRMRSNQRCFCRQTFSMKEAAPCEENLAWVLALDLNPYPSPASYLLCILVKLLNFSEPYCFSTCKK